MPLGGSIAHPSLKQRKGGGNPAGFTVLKIHVRNKCRRLYLSCADRWNVRREERAGCLVGGRGGKGAKLGRTKGEQEKAQVVAQAEGILSQSATRGT